LQRYKATSFILKEGNKSVAYYIIIGET